MFSDPVALDVLARLRPARAASILATNPTIKAAFSPSPAMQQVAMGQGQAAPPAGMDPAAAGGAPPPGGPAPGGDPAAAAGGPPPGAPPADPNVPAGPSPEILELKNMMAQLIQQQQGGGTGPNGKPNTVSMKLEPGHFQQITHDIANVKAVLTQMADQLGLQVPASDLLGQPAPGQPLQPAAEGQGGAAAGGGGASPAGPAGGQPQQPAPFAQQLPSLPSLPPAASKAAADVARTAAMVHDLGRLGAGFIVGGPDSPKAGGSRTAKLAALAARLRKDK